MCGGDTVTLGSPLDSAELGKLRLNHRRHANRGATNHNVSKDRWRERRRKRRRRRRSSSRRGYLL